ncbi:thioredoxin [bacterium BMS3Abin01]|nr:thioredoxin [bacterium BMS3Abin01]HDZ59955.1 thioredoxin [Actinomycetota bacterium]
MVGSNLIEVTDAEFDAEVLQSDIPVLVDFWADWCAPCRMVGPVIAQLAEERVGELKVAKLNVDQNRETAAKYKILSIPTVILFRDGKIDRQVVGALPKESLVRELGL